MTVISKQFFNIFWGSKVCRSIFLLHKTELLECKSVDIDGIEKEVFRPRIIVSNNFEKRETNTVLQLNADNLQLRVENSFDYKSKILKPKIEVLIEQKFGKSIKKLEADLSSKTKALALFFKIAKTLANSEKREKSSIELLQKYGFIGNQINSFEELGKYLESILKKNLKNIISEEHLFHFYDTLELARFYYYSVMSKSMLKSNKILVEALHDQEHYQNRLELLSLLQDSGILYAGQSETYFQCLNCQPGTAFGSALLNIRVKNLNKFKCPVCQTPFFYLAPLFINNEVYQKIINKDGLLLFAVGDALQQSNYKFEYNHIIKPDIEVDIIVWKYNHIHFLIEVKMFTLNSTERKLVQKIKKSLVEIKKQIDKLKGNKDYESVKYVLVTNIMDEALLKQVREETFNDINNYNIEIQSIDRFKKYIDE